MMGGQDMMTVLSGPLTVCFPESLTVYLLENPGVYSYYFNTPPRMMNLPH